MDKLALKNIEIIIKMAKRESQKQKAKEKVQRYIKLLTEDPQEAKEYEAFAEEKIKGEWK